MSPQNELEDRIRKLRRVYEAALRYFAGYVQDEADDEECCPAGRQQHEDAKELEAALSAVSEYDRGGAA